MIEIHLGAQDLGRVRFTVDAVWETTASLNALAFPQSHVLHQRLARRLPTHPGYDHGLLVELTGDRSWIPDVLCPTPDARSGDPRAQLGRILETERSVVEHDLTVLRSRRPRSRAARMTAEELLDSLARALTGYWSAVLEPLWERVHSITQGDIAYHRRLLSSDGLETVLPHLHTELSMSGGVVRAGMHSHAVVDASGNGIWLVPSVFRWPWLAVDVRTHQPVISYAARGAGRVWEEAEDHRDALAMLLGPSRAAILASLVIPRTTTGIAHLLQLAPSTVSQHLSVMTASGLLAATRDGRKVLYARTRVGELLVAGESGLAKIG